MKKITIVIILLIISQMGNAQKKPENDKKAYPVTKTKQEWKKLLTPQQYHILRQKGTEAPGTGVYNSFFKDGKYFCAACGALLFDSDSKFESHCGWPSFDRAVKGAIVQQKDSSAGMIRTEILCANCGGHLGHVFNDGPTKTGLRYCVNSLSLGFKKDKPKH